MPTKWILIVNAENKERGKMVFCGTYIFRSMTLFCYFFESQWFNGLFTAERNKSRMRF